MNIALYYCIFFYLIKSSNKINMLNNEYCIVLLHFLLFNKIL